MITYKVIDSTVGHFKNIEIPLDFSNNCVGDLVNVLGMNVHITQLGTEIVGCSNPENVIILQKIT